MEGTEVIQRVAETLTDDFERLKTSLLVSEWHHEPWLSYRSLYPSPAISELC